MNMAYKGDEKKSDCLVGGIYGCFFLSATKLQQLKESEKTKKS
jgi:hypothetical protein